MTYVVDSHALVWFLEANLRLSMAARNALIDTTAEVVVPIIVLVVGHLAPVRLAFVWTRADDVPMIWCSGVAGLHNTPSTRFLG